MPSKKSRSKTAVSKKAGVDAAAAAAAAAANTPVKIELTLKEKNGIVYYMDDEGHSYNMYDVMGERPNPRILNM
jgi:hypothetical protein